MYTTGNNKPFNGAEYNSEENLAKYYEGGYVVAVLDFSTDVFDNYEDMSEEDKDLIYSEMVKEKNSYEYKCGQVLVESDYR